MLTNLIFQHQFHINLRPVTPGNSNPGPFQHPSFVSVLKHRTTFVMAPRRGGGGGGGYSSFSCPDAYSTPYRQAALAYYVLFMVLFIGIFVSVFFVRRRSGVGKKVIGVPFVIAVFLEVV